MQKMPFFWKAFLTFFTPTEAEIVQIHVTLAVLAVYCVLPTRNSIIPSWYLLPRLSLTL